MDHRGLDDVRLGDEGVHRDTATHRPAQHADPVRVNLIELTKCLDGRDRVTRVAKAQLELDRIDVVGTRVSPIVRVQHDVAPARQVVLLAPHALTVLIDRRVDVTVVEDHGWVGTRTVGHQQQSGDRQVAAAVADLLTGVGTEILGLTDPAEVTTGDVLVEHRRQRLLVVCRRRAGCRCGARRRPGRTGFGAPVIVRAPCGDQCSDDGERDEGEPHTHASGSHAPLPLR